MNRQYERVNRDYGKRYVEYPIPEEEFWKHDEVSEDVIETNHDTYRACNPHCCDIDVRIEDDEN